MALAAGWSAEMAGMFGNTKPTASLSSGLLARKGQARPAMRPQGFVGLAPSVSQLEDLGWNDMGDEPEFAPGPSNPQLTPHPKPVAQPVPPVLRERDVLVEAISQPAPVQSDPIVEEVVEIDPVPVEPEATSAPAPAPEPEPEPAPEPTVQTAPVEPVIEDEGPYEPAPPTPVAATTRPVSVATATRISREVTDRRNKAAFTLRLAADRHLRLRLASAISGRSSQQIVAEALDQFLDNLPEVDDLARQLPARKNRR